MQKNSLVLALVALACGAQADTLFDSIHSDAAGATPRSTFTGFSSLTSNKLTGGWFTLSSAATLTDISFLYQNASGSAITSISGSLQIFKTVPTTFDTKSSALAFTDPLFSSPISLNQSVASTANGGIGTGTVSVSPTDLSAGTYGFTLKFNATQKVSAVVTYGDSYGAGSGNPAYSAGFLADITGASSALKQSDAFVLNSPNTNVALSLSGTPRAVPEPGTWAALGLGAVAVLRRRKRA